MAGLLTRFFDAIKAWIAWSWRYLWAAWFCLVVFVVYMLRGPLKLGENFNYGECRCPADMASSQVSGFVWLCHVFVATWTNIELKDSSAVLPFHLKRNEDQTLLSAGIPDGAANQTSETSPVCICPHCRSRLFARSVGCCELQVSGACCGFVCIFMLP